jgi:hypothetical protein
MDEDEERRRRRSRAVLLLLQDDNNSRFDLFRDKLSLEGRRRRFRQIPRPALPDPENSPWAILYKSGDDGALITVTGFDHDTFQHMLDLFSPLYDKFSPWTRQNDGYNYKKRKCFRRGRKRKVTAAACLGLVLAW